MSGSISQFQFRGSRNYLHSTTVFDWVITQASDLHEIDFQFKKLTPNQCQVVENSSSDQEIVAMFRSKDLNLDFVETDEPMDSSYPCNEKAICEETKFDGGCGSFSFPLNIEASFLEAIVAVYKEMLSKTPEGSRGKLLFGRVKLNCVPKSGECVVKHRREIGKGFFEASIICDDNKVGALYFGQS